MPTSGSIPGSRPGTRLSHSATRIVDPDFAGPVGADAPRELLHPATDAAYEWNFSDVNPGPRFRHPLLAGREALHRETDFASLARFQKLC